MANKTFKNLDQQIEILYDRGLTITDYETTRNILLRENYFFISGYRHPFLERKDQYLKGTTFEELYALFLFDRQIRNIIFKNILIFENNLKSILSHILSKNHGFKESTYLNPKTLTKDPTKSKMVADVVRKMKRQIMVNGNQHTATKHFIYNYGFIPLWVVVKVLSFGLVGELYKVLKEEDQYEIADLFEIRVSKLINYLPILANYRNLSAHEDICYENRTQKHIDDTIYHEILKIDKKEEEFTKGKNDLFALVIILKHVLEENDFKMFMNEIDYELDVLKGRLKIIKIDKILNRMGFPENYRALEGIDKVGKF